MINVGQGFGCSQKRCVGPTCRSTLNPKPWTINPKPQTLNPRPWTRSHELPDPYPFFFIPLEPCREDLQAPPRTTPLLIYSFRALSWVLQLTNLCRNWLLQNDIIDTFCDINVSYMSTPGHKRKFLTFGVSYPQLRIKSTLGESSNVTWRGKT